MGIAAWTARGVALGVLVALLSTLVTSAQRLESGG